MESARFHYEICPILWNLPDSMYEIRTEYMKSGGFHEIRQMSQGPMVLFFIIVGNSFDEGNDSVYE